jgi:hypothetical protein
MILINPTGEYIKLSAIHIHCFERFFSEGMEFGEKEYLKTKKR